jgi:hemolysin activation/secretion protein
MRQIPAFIGALTQVLRGIICVVGLSASTLSVATALEVQQSAAAATTTSSAAAGQAEQRFDVKEYRVVGNTVLDIRAIERLLYPLLGTAKSLSDVEVARAALEKLYHDQGFGTVFVDIPPQTIDDGLVRLRVTEGRVERTVVSGARYFPERDVIARLPATTPGTVLQLSELRSQLNAVNTETADRAVVPILKAGSAPGTVDLALQVNDHLPLHGSLELNNQATIDTRSLRSIASLSYGDLFGRMDSISFQYQATPQQIDQVRVIAVNYVAHAFDSGLQPSLMYVNSNSNVPAAGTLGVLGIGEVTGLRLAYALPGQAPDVQSLTLGLDYKHFRNTINQSAMTALDTPISYLNISLAYAGLWRSDLLTTETSLSANLGPRGLVNNSSAFENDRFKGNANYFYLRGDIGTIIKLPGNFSLRLRIAGQAATEPLITNEDFSIAGVDAVRGYLESEELGDKAIKETVQLNSPGWHRGERILGDVYLFFDAGRSWVIDPLPGEPTGAILRSWGAGIDLLPAQKFTGSLSYARTLTAASETRANESRFLFVLRASF